MKHSLTFDEKHVAEIITFHNDADVKSSCHKLFTLSNTVTDEYRPSIRHWSKWFVGILLTFTREILQHHLLIKFAGANGIYRQLNSK